MKIPKKLISFRLSDDTIRTIKRIADVKHMSEAQVVEESLWDYWDTVKAKEHSEKLYAAFISGDLSKAEYEKYLQEK
jgi:predicted transcriptional regulator